MWYALLFVFIQGTAGVTVTQPDFYTQDECRRYVVKNIQDFQDVIDEYGLHESMATGNCFYIKEEKKV
jgi:hypothetical protein